MQQTQHGRDLGVHVTGPTKAGFAERAYMLLLVQEPILIFHVTLSYSRGNTSREVFKLSKCQTAARIWRILGEGCVQDPSWWGKRLHNQHTWSP